MAIDSIGQWLNAAGRVPLLTHREELLLGRAVQAWQQWPGGADAAPAQVQRRGLRARQRMVCANLRLVVSVAKRYGRYAVLRQVAQEDLLQAGAIGLQRAAEKFDPSSGYKFSTYATWWIRQALPREIWRGGMVRIPQNVGEQIQRLQESDIATLSASQRATLAAAQATLSVAALDAPAGGEDHCALADLIAADGADPFIQIEAERLATAAPEAWAAGLKAINRRGLDSAPGRAILKKLRAAIAG